VAQPRFKYQTKPMMPKIAKMMPATGQLGAKNANDTPDNKRSGMPQHNRCRMAKMAIDRLDCSVSSFLITQMKPRGENYPAVQVGGALCVGFGSLVNVATRTNDSSTQRRIRGCPSKNCILSAIATVAKCQRLAR
jgi:hypothetical protein